MPAHAPSYPPPPCPRKPGLARCKPEKEARRRATAKWLTAWCIRHGVSVRDLAAMLGVSRGVAHDMLKGEKPFHLEDAAGLGRYCEQFLIDYMVECSRSVANDHG